MSTENANELTMRAICLHPEYSEGGITFGIYFSTQTDDDEDIRELLDKWVNTDEDVFINFRFSLSDCVDDVIELNRFGQGDTVILSNSDKPMVDALRAELADQLRRLDAIKFVDKP